MTPENMPAPPAGSTTPTPALRPPDFLLPSPDQAASRRRGEPDIYISWGGKIYGPSGVNDVISRVRTSYFEEEALFWFEGRSEWRPVEELPDLFAGEIPEPPGTAVPHTPPAEPIRPPWPGTSSASRSRRGPRRGHHRRGRTSRADRNSRTGRLIVLGAVLLAVALTAGLLLLISLA